MPGIRERQKKERRAAILDSAEESFTSHGFVETGMNDIARGAGLAVGTLYNYFPSKPEIVLALVRREFDQTVAAAEVLVRRPPPNPVVAVTKLLDLVFAPFIPKDRALWQELVSAAIRDPQIATSFFESDLRLVAQLDRLLRALQARGDVRPDSDAGRSAIVLYGTFFVWFMAVLTNDALTLDEARAEVRLGAAVVMNGLLAPGQTLERP